MEFRVGDTVMHWNHGLGQIVGLEERDMVGQRQLYYVVKIQDFSVWVPADKLVGSRLRPPASAKAFKALLAILSGPAQALPGDRQERKSLLNKELTAGDAAAVCHVVRDLTSLSNQKTLNYDDKSALKRARTMLLGEWEYALGISLSQAEDDLHRLLQQSSSQPAG